MKHFYFFIISLLSVFNSFSQTPDIQIAKFDATLNYVEGESISVILDTPGIFPLNHTFTMELSDAAGSFANPVVLATENEFFLPIMNGIIPSGTPVGAGYKIRITSDLDVNTDGIPDIIPVETNAFSISAAGANSLGFDIVFPNLPVGFIDCLSNNSFGFLNKSSGDLTSLLQGNIISGNTGLSDTNFTANLYPYDIGNNEMDITNAIPVNVASLFGPITFDLSAGQSTNFYVFEIISQKNGLSTSKAYVYHFNTGNSGISNLSSEEECVGNVIEFEISTGSMSKNYPGSKYTLDFGDGNSALNLTHAQIFASQVNGVSGSKWSHTYNESTCSSSNQTANGNNGYYFQVQFKLFNKNYDGLSCDTYYENGNGTTKWVNISLPPEPDFTVPVTVCIQDDLEAIENVTPGQYGLGQACLTDYNVQWKVETPNGTEFQVTSLVPDISVDPNTNNLTISSTFLQNNPLGGPGCYKITLIVNNLDGGCTVPSPISKTVQVQAVPDPSFTFSPQTIICPGDTVSFTNTSSIFGLNCQVIDHIWSVMPVSGTPATSSGFNFEIDPSQPSSVLPENYKNPDITFTQEGQYKVEFSIINACGAFTDTEIITIAGDPTVNFSPGIITICEDIDNKGYAIDFNDTSFSPTYSSGAFAPTNYNWTVSGTGVTAADYSFINGTNATSPYPIIQFNEYKTYIITVDVGGNCSISNQAVFTFEYKRSPKITNTNFVQSLCSGEITTAVNLSSDLSSTTFQWTINAPAEISGETSTTSGTTIPAMTLINGTNLPLDLIITVTPEKDGCPGTAQDFIFTVNPTPVIPNQTATICSEEIFTITPQNNEPTTIVPSATTYAWTVVDNPNLSGDVDEPNPQNDISQQLINNTNTLQTVIYTVTPISGATGNCVGADFTIEVTVEPKPDISNITGITICSGETFTAIPTNNPPASIVPIPTTYTWTVGGNPDVTGEADETVPQSSISQQLVNTSDLPQTVVYTVTPVSGNCTGQNFTVEVTVDPSPVISDQNVAICSGDSFTVPISNNPPSSIIPANTTYTWTVVDNPNVTGDVNEPTPQVQISQQLTNLTNVDQTVVYIVTPTSGAMGNCQGADFTVNVVVHPTPVVPDQTVTICSGDFFTVSPSNNPPSTIVPNTTTYTWSVMDNLNVNGDLPQTTPQTQISQQLTTNGSVPETVVYTVTPLDPTGNCAGPDFTLTLTINPAPVVPDSNETICSGEIFTVTPVNNGTSTIVFPGTTYTWTVVDNPNITGDTDESVPQSNISQQLTNITNTPQTVVYTVTPNSGASGNCSGATFTINVQVNPTPIIQDQNMVMCSGQTFSVIPVNNPPASIVPTSITYTWTVADNPDITGDLDETTPQTQISQQLTNNTNVPQTVVYTVTPESGSCIGNNFDVTITVNPIPVMDPISPQTICSGTAFTNVAPTSNVGGTTFSWVLQNTGVPGTITGYPTSGSGVLNGSTISNTGTSPYTLNYEFTPVYGNCTGMTEIFQVTINPAPEVQFDIPNQDICSGAASTVVSISSQTPGVSISWQINSIPVGLSGVTQTTGTNTIPSFTLVNSTTNPINLLIEASSETSGAAVCPGISNTYTITIYPEIILATQPIPTQSICEGGTANALNVAYSGGTGNPSYQWYTNTINSNSGGTIIPGATATTYTPPPFTSTGLFYFYAVISLDGDGCGAVTSDVAVVEVVPDPTIDTQPLVNQTKCIGATADQLQVSVSGGLGTLSYQWYSNTVNANIGGTAIPGETSANFTPPTNTVGTIYYYVVATQNVSGCETASMVSEVEVVPAPGFNQHPSGSIVCLNGDAPDLTVSYIDGTGTPSYQWYSNTVNSTAGGTAIPGATAPTYDPPTGTVGSMFYYVVVSFNIGGCSTITSNPAEVQVVPLPNISTQPVPTQSICEGGTASTLTVAYSEGVGTPSYQWYENTTNSNSGGTPIPGATTAAYTPPPFTSVGTYYFYAVVSLDGAGCGSATSDVAVIEVVPDPTIDTQLLAQQIQCVGSTADQLHVSVSGGLGTLSYQWYSNTVNANIGGTAISGETSANFTPPTSTIGTFYYYVVATQNVSGCETISTVSEVEVVPVPSFDQHPSGSVVCLNGDAPDLSFSYIDGTGSVSYQWYSNTSNSTTGGTAIPGATAQTYDPPTGTLGSMFYYVEITFSDTGCGAIVSNPAEVMIIPLGQVDPVGDLVVCHLEVVPGIVFTTPDTSGNTFFQWTNSNPSIGLGASGMGDIPSFTALNSTINPISATITVTPVYSLGGTDCQGTPTSFTITIGGEIQVTPVFSDYNGFGVSCFDSQDGSIDITAQGGAPFSSTPFYQYNWSGPNGFTSTSKFINNLLAGNYVLTITDSAGCSYDFIYIVSAPPEIIIQDDAVQDVLCNGEFNGNILITPTGGAGSFTYVWMKNGLPAAITQDFQNIGPGLYTLIVTDANGCTKTKDYVISEPDPIQINVVNLSSVLCFGDTDTGNIDIEVSGGTPLETAPGVFEYTYSWTGPNGYASSSQDIANVPAGIYTVTVFDNLGCEASLDIEIIEPDPLVVNFEVTNESCSGADDGSITALVQGGTPPYFYLWGNGATTATIINLAPGNYTLLVTDSNACEQTAQIQVGEAPQMEIEAVVENISCNGFNDGKISLSVTGGNPVSEDPSVFDYDYYWQGPGNFMSTQATIENLIAGIYTVRVTDALGCEMTESYTITEPPVLEATYESSDVFCFGVNDGSIDLTISGGVPPYEFLWNNGETTVDVENLSPGNYEVAITDVGGCTIELSIEIKPDYVVIVPPPIGESVQEFCMENQPVLSDVWVEGLEIIWYADPFYTEELLPNHPLTNGEVVYAQNFDESTGCYSEELLKVEIIVHDTTLKIYNLITVDGNNMNSRLKVEGIERFPDNTMSIFNRYGKLVWKTNDYNNTDHAFRGMANQGGLVVQRGEFLPTGTYFYVLEYPNPCMQTSLDGYLQIDNKN